MPEQDSRTTALTGPLSAARLASSKPLIAVGLSPNITSRRGWVGESCTTVRF